MLSTFNCSLYKLQYQKLISTFREFTIHSLYILANSYLPTERKASQVTVIQVFQILMTRKSPVSLLLSDHIWALIFEVSEVAVKWNDENS